MHTLSSAVLSFRWLHFRRQLLSTADGHDYCVWWPYGKGRVAKRCWVLVPGGMSTGRDFYITSLGRSAAVAPDESWVVFHNPGQGGSKCRGASEHGLTRTDCLSHFLRQIRDSFQTIVVVGFSAGGMPVMNLAQDDDPVADAFVSVCSPDRIRLVFENQSSWWLRVDVFFALWFHLCARDAGLFHAVPFKAIPFPPTWEGYMKPFTEKNFETATGRKMSWEEIEDDHFDGSLKKPPSAPCLRIWCKDDPIVTTETLDHTRFKHSDVWWEDDGGHCGQCYWSQDFPLRLREWVVQATERRGASAQP